MEDQCFICGNDEYHTQMIDGGGPISLNLCWPCQNKIDAGIEMTVFKKVRIEMAHCIYGHQTCGKIHGHSVDIVIGVKGFMDLNTGMVIDFKTLKYIIEDEVVKPFDHAYLNDTLPIPTAEYFAFYLYEKLTKTRNLDVVLVRIHETENNYVEYTGRYIDLGDEIGE
jgi:6-pyruvoyltetrahydropterin/6-carboxytetrahydropterin synthase